MPCYHPKFAWFAKRLTAEGKRRLVFQAGADDADMSQQLELPCGDCVGCKLERARQWSVRIAHEASLYEHNSFITLTYADEFLPPGGSLVKKDFQKFMKRLRKRYVCSCEQKPSGDVCGRCGLRKSIRYFMCGEYGSKRQRPHYHAVLFGFRFPDRLPLRMSLGYAVYESTALRELWPYGRSEIGSLTVKSAKYVAGYVVKKWFDGEYGDSVDGETGEVWERVAPYASMSLKPGLGKRWLEKWQSDTWRDDAVLVGQKLEKPPRYYDVLLERENPELLKQLKEVRMDKARTMNVQDKTPERLAVRESNATIRAKLFSREVD